MWTTATTTAAATATTTNIITSAERRRSCFHLCMFVCLSVCSQHFGKTDEWIVMKFSGQKGLGDKEQSGTFWAVTFKPLDTGFHGNLCLSATLGKSWKRFHYIHSKRGAWNKEQSVTFSDCWFNYLNAGSIFLSSGSVFASNIMEKRVDGFSRNSLWNVGHDRRNN